jgi:hypothetical protein
MMEKSAQAGEDGGGHAQSLFTLSTITYKVVVYTPPISSLPLYVLCECEHLKIVS